MHVKLVRVDRPLHHGFTQAVAGRNKHHIRKAGFGIDGEHDTRGTDVRAHHALDSGAQGHVLVGKTLVNPVTDGAVVVQRGKHLTNFVQNFFNADNVQKGFLLSCK